MAEFEKGDKLKASSKAAQETYQEAMALAQQHCLPASPIRLGLALNYSVFVYEIGGDQQGACRIAKEAFDEALKSIDELPEETYREASLIMQLLRENQSFWQQSSQQSQP